MHLHQLRPIGLNRRFTHGSFVVLLVEQLLQRRSRFGSIGDRPSLPIAKVVNGKSFTTVTVAPHGGLGVAIALPANLPLTLPHQNPPNCFGD